MKVHDWLMENRDAINEFDVWYRRTFPATTISQHRTDLLKSFIYCWHLFLPPIRTTIDNKKAWNGMPMCGTKIRRMPFHPTEESAICALPRMQGKDQCWRHGPKASPSTVTP